MERFKANAETRTISPDAVQLLVNDAGVVRPVAVQEVFLRPGGADLVVSETLAESLPVQLRITAPRSDFGPVLSRDEGNRAIVVFETAGTITSVVNAFDRATEWILRIRFTGNFHVSNGRL